MIDAIFKRHADELESLGWEDADTVRFRQCEARQRLEVIAEARRLERDRAELIEALRSVVQRRDEYAAECMADNGEVIGEDICITNARALLSRMEKT